MSSPCRHDALKSDGDDLKKMVKLFDEGKLKVCVDEHFAFDEVK